MIIKNICIFLSIFISLNAKAGLDGLFFHKPYKDEITIFVKNGRLILKIWDSAYPNIPACHFGYQIYPSRKPEISNEIKLSSHNIVSFSLYLTGECLAAQTLLSGKFSYQTIEQEIDIYLALAMYKNGQSIATSFKNGNINFALFGQSYLISNPNQYYSFELTYTYEDALEGRILLNKSYLFK